MIRASRIAAVLLPLLLLAAAVDSAGAALGLCVFVEGEGVAAAPVSGLELRQQAEAILGRSFQSAGWILADEESLIELAAHWRVRDADALSAGFLNELREQGLCDRLLVVRLRLFEDMLVLATRLVGVADGRILAADLVGGALPEQTAESSSAWWRVLGETARQAAQRCPRAASVPGTRGLVVLPVQGIGLGSAASGLLGDALLKRLLQQGEWWIPDPGLVLTWLRKEGAVPLRLPVALRQRLGGRFDDGLLLRPELTGYPRIGAGRAARFGGGAEDEAVRSLMLELHASMQLVDAKTGFIAQFARVDLPAVPARGLFGTVPERNGISRIDNLAAELVAALANSASNEPRKEQP